MESGFLFDTLEVGRFASGSFWIVQNSCQSLALELFVSATHVQIERFKKIIFMTQDLYQFDQKLELYTTAFSDL
jgi:hypothetical protein